MISIPLLEIQSIFQKVQMHKRRIKSERKINS